MLWLIIFLMILALLWQKIGMKHYLGILTSPPLETKSWSYKKKFVASVKKVSILIFIRKEHLDSWKIRKTSSVFYSSILKQNYLFERDVDNDIPHWEGLEHVKNSLVRLRQSQDGTLNSRLVLTPLNVIIIVPISEFWI